MTEAIVVLEADRVTYYSPLDETAFFEWLERIDAVKRFHGKGTTLFIEVDDSKMDQMSLRNLIALFYRYQVDLSQLAQFCHGRRNKWMRSRDTFWFQGMFGRSDRAE